jgi:hypothetical protein
MQDIRQAPVGRPTPRIIGDYRGLSGIQALLGFECLAITPAGGQVLVGSLDCWRARVGLVGLNP